MPTTTPSISAQLRTAFPDTTRKRGQDYFVSGRVDLEESTPEGGRGTVLGSEIYRVSLGRESGEWLGACSCPAFRKLGPCKHLWALALAIEAGGSEESSEPPRTKRGLPGAARVTEAPRSEWRHRIERALPWIEESSHDPWQGLATPGVELAYLLHTDRRYELGDSCVSALRRKWQRNGRWGRWRPYRPDEFDEPDPPGPADLRILDTLTTASPLDSRPWNWSPIDVSFPLGDAVTDALLPELCRTGRLHRADPEIIGKITRPGSTWAPPATGALVYDEGAPWTLALRFVRDENEKVSRLLGTLERGDEKRPCSDVDFIVTQRHLLAGSEVLPFEGSRGWLLALRDGGSISTSFDDEHRMIQLLHLVPSPPIAGIPEELTPRNVRPTPHLWVESSERTRKWRPHLHCRISFDYEGTRVPMTHVASAVRKPDGEQWVARDREAEREALQTFLEHGVRIDDELEDADATLPARDLPRTVSALLAAGWTVEAEGVPYRRAGNLRLSVTSGMDWFDLEGGLSFDDETVSVPALLEAARTGKRVIHLGDGSYGVLPEEWLEGWGLLGELAEVREESLRFRPSQAWLLDALLADHSVDADREFARLRKRIAGFEGIRPAKEGRTFRGTLRPYQREGLAWLRFLRDVRLGGCLADDMGLGKTVQVLALLDADRTRGRQAGTHRPSLVVVPRSVVHNWIEEAGRFAPNLRVLEYTGTRRRSTLPSFPEHDLVVTTYGLLRRDVLLLKDQEFDWVILDESQAIKNERSQSAKSARLLQSEHRLALSGTPVENHLGELWSLFEFLNPGMLGRSRAFKDLVRRKDLDEEDHASLAAAIRPFLLRRTKEQVLTDLPAKTEQTIHCELDRGQRRDYSAIRDHYRRSLLAQGEKGLSGMKIQVLEALLRLRQAACHPGLIDRSRTGESSAKLDALLPLLDEVRESGHKALVFSQFTKLLAIVRARLDAGGVTYEYLDGRTRDRKAKVDRFQNDDACPLFLISLKAGGLGLNLTAADYVFLLDPWWNPAVEAQAVDRAHRIGQKRPVTAYRLICRDTVEEKVLELQQRKRDLADAIIASDGSLLRDLTRADLERLLS